MTSKLPSRNELHLPSSQQTLAPDAAQLERWRHALSSTITLLNAFNHRHRNQHRAAHWWAAFGIFRRSLSNLYDTCGHAKRLEDPGPSKITERARWIRENIVPRSYVAFSQLVADNQHSPLGLLLLTELARVQQLLADILAIDSSDSSLQDGLPQSERSIVRHSIQSPSNCVEGDKGVTISRDKMALDAIGEQVPPPVKRGRPETEPHYRDCTNGLDRDRDRSGGKKKSKKKQKRGTNDLASLFGSLT